MPRPPRLQFAGALYHVMSRGNARQRIFRSDDDRRRFLRQLRDNLATYDVRLYAYVLMPNHYHLLIQTRRANLARFMQRLGSSYALYFRYKHRWPGHVLQGRYRAKLVGGDEYLLPLSRYIHLNPVRTAAAGRLPKRRRLGLLEKYPWSSLAGYVRQKAAETWICYDLLRQFGSTPAHARRHYRAYVQACLMEDDAPLREALRASRYAIGSPAFAKKVEKMLQKQREARPAQRDLDLPRPLVDLQTIDRIVAEAFRIDPARLRQHGRRAGEAKAFAIELACRLTDWNQRQLGAYYGGITSMAVCMARRRFREEGTPGHQDLRARLAKLENAVLAEK